MEKWEVIGFTIFFEKKRTISIDYNHIIRKPSFAEVAQDREAWRLLENADSLYVLCSM